MHTTVNAWVTCAVGQDNSLDTNDDLWVYYEDKGLVSGAAGDFLCTAYEVADDVAVQDIGAAAAAAVQEPSRFHGVELELASQRLTMREIARALSRALGLPIEAPSLTADEAIARGLMPMIARPHARLNHYGSPATPEAVRALGIPLTDFETWLRHHRV
ncbi:hypothetical protein BE20_09735 [Sorangium cellulosum]|uniref:NmrA-like domain-containing protein n=1 Tax=Sorangium cellulosum TaxID=56 RepID=A0A150SLL5_SORCE|nr:hypothetical protein BE20_09735 [Sorangium cellulosum]KYF98942.1 hypothetical protein BE18_52930 [Sorangium cellulosum]